MKSYKEIMSKYIGFWWLVIWSSKNKIIEIGFGECLVGTNEVFQTREYRKIGLYLAISRPTLLYIKQEGLGTK